MTWMLEQPPAAFTAAVALRMVTEGVKLEWASMAAESASRVTEGDDPIVFEFKVTDQPKPPGFGPGTDEDHVVE